ncbi:MAG: hypothetical protein JWO22_4175, partial [Frankiales bacterium]|nr:hypothetical protein [Frankiales bacterium]
MTGHRSFSVILSHVYSVSDIVEMVRFPRDYYVEI